MIKINISKKFPSKTSTHKVLMPRIEVETLKCKTKVITTTTPQQ